MSKIKTQSVNKSMAESSVSDDHGQILMSWDIPEFTKYKRSKMWYVWFVAIVLFLITVAVYQTNFLFAAIVVMLALVFILHDFREPVPVKCALTEDGLELGQKFYPWKEIKNFWIIYEPPEVKNLYFVFKGFWRPVLSIELIKNNPIEVRKILLNYLEEDLSQENESASDNIGRILKL